MFLRYKMISCQWISKEIEMLGGIWKKMNVLVRRGFQKRGNGL
jgi:hypothetical protein